MTKAEFERILDRSFGILETTYGLKKTESTFRKSGVSVFYENPTTRLLLNYDMGEEPWLTLIDLQNSENKSTLGWLMVELGVVKTPTPEEAFQDKELDKEQLEPFLRTMASQMNQYGSDILHGDFSIFPKLQDRAKKYIQECKRYAQIHKA